MDDNKKATKSKYNKIPVYYCKECLSLRIMRVGISGVEEDCYCDDCGSTNIMEASIEEWQNLRDNRYRLHN